MIFIGSINSKKIGGEVLKNQILLNFLQKKYQNLIIIDIEKYKDRKLLLFILLSYYYFFVNDDIILSKADHGAYNILRLFYFFNKFKKKKIYYFVIGGLLNTRLKNNYFEIKYYKDLFKIYVELNSMKKDLEKLNMKNVEWIPNFKKFEIKYRKKEVKNVLKAVFFSRITEEKGTEIIFQMLQQINKEKIKIEVDFYGSIAEEYKQRFENNLSLIPSAKYKGILSQEEKTYDLLSKYDFMLFPTFWKGEGFPGSLIDAFISSLPVVASDWNYNKEIINEKVGYLFENKNQKQFEKIIFDLINDPKQLLEKRKNCFEEAKKYHIDNVLRIF